MSQPTTPQSDFEYVFGHDPGSGFCRWGWIVDCIQGDIQTFLDGMKYCYPWRGELQRLDGVSRGGGNLGAPIVIMSCLELLARLYSPNDRSHRPYNATDNVKTFLAAFVGGHAAAVPGLLWDGIRNGLTHSFRPKPIMCHGIRVEFQFCQDRFASSLERTSPTGAAVRISVPDLFEALRSATQRYGDRLRAEATLQANFRNAWEALDARSEPRVKDPIEEAALAHLLTGVQTSHGVGLFDANVRVAPDPGDPSVSHYCVGTDHLYSLRFGAAVPPTSQGTASCTQVPTDLIGRLAGGT